MQQDPVKNRISSVAQGLFEERLSKNLLMWDQGTYKALCEMVKPEHAKDMCIF